MVDVGAKPETQRRAVALATLQMSAEAFETLSAGTVPKGNALGVARLAGIQAAKRTADWIPLCHTVPLDQVEIDFQLDGDQRRVTISATARARGRTGVEMEALVAASAAALGLYDMLKAIDRAMIIESVYLAEKSGGQSGDFRHPGPRR